MISNDAPFAPGTFHQSLLSSFASAAPPRKRRKVDVNIPSSLMTDQLTDRKTKTSDEALFAQLSEGEEEDAIAEGIDPFSKHFENVSTTELTNTVSKAKQENWTIRRQKVEPGCLVWSARLSDDTTNVLQSDSLPQSLALKKRLSQRAMKMISSLQPSMEKMRDLLFAYEDVVFPLRNSSNAATLREITCAHILNHLLKTRDRILKNNARISKEPSNPDMDVRDQGFTRPKALILLPTKQSCARYAETLVSLYAPEQQENRKRFQEAFSSPGGDLSADKPDDFRELFEGNDDDLFRIGIKFTRKTVKFFSKFYNSDIIIASPLGIRMAIGQGENNAAHADFLSSVEILLMDHADALYMQNWEHVESIIDHTGLQPREAHGCDFGRVRSWYLDGHAKFVRQTIAISSYNFAPLNRLYTKDMLNFAGKNKFVQDAEGMITQLSITPKQTFLRFSFGKVTDEPDERFRHFTQAILPRLLETTKRSKSEVGALVFVPSYADFLRVRNYIAAAPNMQNVSFGAISEYTPVNEVARARTHFLSGRHSILLYTERVHHFRRYHLKGVKQILMYALPENPAFYKEIVEGFLGASMASGKVGPRDVEIRMLFSCLDVLKLERIVGTEKYHALLNQDGDTFDFVG